MANHVIPPRKRHSAVGFGFTGPLARAHRARNDRNCRFPKIGKKNVKLFVELKTVNSLVSSLFAEQSH